MELGRRKKDIMKKGRKRKEKWKTEIKKGKLLQKGATLRVKRVHEEYMLACRSRGKKYNFGVRGEIWLSVQYIDHWPNIAHTKHITKRLLDTTSSNKTLLNKMSLLQNVSL
jgi:hypothetical protein